MALRLAPLLLRNVAHRQPSPGFSAIIGRERTPSARRTSIQSGQRSPGEGPLGGARGPGSDPGSVEFLLWYAPWRDAARSRIPRTSTGAAASSPTHGATPPLPAPHNPGQGPVQSKGRNPGGRCITGVMLRSQLETARTLSMGRERLAPGVQRLPLHQARQDAAGTHTSFAPPITRSAGLLMRARSRSATWV